MPGVGERLYHQCKVMLRSPAADPLRSFSHRLLAGLVGEESARWFYRAATARLWNAANADKARLRRAAEFVNTGSPRALAMIMSLKRTSKSRLLDFYLDRLVRRHNAIQRLRFLPWVHANRRVMEDLHGDAGYAYIAHPQGSPDLMVVCLTRFNNFGVSPAVIAALLLECGYSVLVLKDRTTSRFLQGVPGLGRDLKAVADAIMRLCREKSLSSVYCTGFSSGGYASLFLASILDCRGYAGFAVELDYRQGSQASRRYSAVNGLQGVVAPSYLCDLREMLVKQTAPRPIIFYAGSEDKYDISQLAGVDGLGGCQVRTVVGCDHNVPVFLIENGGLKQIFAELLCPAASRG